MAHLGPLVLKANSLKNPTLTADRDQPVLRRFEPSSRSALMGEQTNPWDLLQPQDALSRPKIYINYVYLCSPTITSGLDYIFRKMSFIISLALFTYWRLISNFKKLSISSKT